MAADNHNLGYEQLYQERLNETKSMITLATLLDFLDQGTGNGIDYRLVMAEARAIAEEANHDGLPSATPDVTLIAIKISTWHSLSCGKVDRFVSDCLVKKLFADILNCFIAGAWTAYCAHARMMP